MTTDTAAGDRRAAERSEGDKRGEGGGGVVGEGGARPLPCARWIDLNADVGEGMPGEEAVWAWVTSANIACGGHAGDETTMRAALRRARALGVAAGAHPGYADRANFGRVELGLAPVEIEAQVAAQVAALARLAAEEGVALRHVKPHGALYHRAASDSAAAVAVVRGAVAGMAAVEAGEVARWWLVAPPGSCLVAAGAAAGVAVRAEGFVDRAYEPDGSLLPRSAVGALLTDTVAVARQAVRLWRVGVGPAGWPVQTLCLHGDTPDAGLLAQAVREALAAAGALVRAEGDGTGDG